MKIRKVSAKKAISKIQAVLIVIVIIIAGVGIGLYWMTQQTPIIERKIKIGFVAPLTGGASPTGQDMMRGATLAVEELNEQGGIFVDELGGKAQVELILGDTKTTREDGISAVTKLTTSDNVDVLVGGFSSAITIGSSPIASENGVPWVITGSSSYDTTRRTDTTSTGELIREWLFHYQEVGDFQGESISSSLVDIVKPIVAPDRDLKVAFIFQDSAFGEGYFEGFLRDINDNNLPIEVVPDPSVKTITFKLGETNYRDILLDAMTYNPDVIVPMGFGGETVNAINQGISELGINIIWGPVCTCVDDPTYYTNLSPGKVGEYTMIQTLYSTYATPAAGAEALEAFRSNYFERWGENPGSQGVTSYDAIYIVAKAIEEAGSLDKENIKNTLETIEIPQLTLPVKDGIIKFNEVHEVRFDIYVTQLVWDSTANELRPVTVWPDHLKTHDFVLPPDYETST